MGEMHATYDLRNTHNVICKIRINRIIFFVHKQFNYTGYGIGIRAYHKLCHMASEKANIEPPVVL